MKRLSVRVGAWAVGSLLVAMGARAQTNYFWVNPVGSAWSGANWTNALVTPSSPAAGGYANYILNFGQAASFIADNDLAGDFVLNRLVATAGAPTLTGNALVFTNNGATLPSITNSGSGILSVSNALLLATNLTVGVTSLSTSILAGAISGAGGLTTAGAGLVVLSGNNSYGGLTVIGTTGTTLLNNTTGGLAIPGNVQVNAGANVFLRFGADEQIADTAIVTFGSGQFGRIVLLGHTETVGGLSDTGGKGIVEDTDNFASETGLGPAKFIVDVAAGSNFVFAGYVRDHGTGAGASNLLTIVKKGAGSQFLTGGNIGNGGLSLLRVENGTLGLSNTTHAAFTTPILVEGGRVLLAATTDASKNPITNNATAGLAFAIPTAYTIGSLSGSGSVVLTNAAGSAVTLNVGGNNLGGSYAGAIEGAGALVKTGTATQVLSGNNTYTGGTTVHGGILLATQTSALPGYDVAGKVVVNAATLGVRTGGVGEWSATDLDTLLANATWNAGSMAGIDVSSGSISLAGNIGGNQGLNKLGTGTLVLSGNNTYAGGTTLMGGILSVETTAHLPIGTLNVTGGTLRITGTSIASLDAYTLNAAGFRGGIDVADASHTLTLNQNLSGSGSVTKDGAGTLVLNGVSTLFGGVTNLAGVLRLGNALSWTSNCPLRVMGGAVDLSGFAVSMASLGGTGGSITNNGGMFVNQGVDATFAGIITGLGGLSKTGGSTLVLSGGNNFTGLTVIHNNSGTLVLSNTLGQAIAGDIQLGNLAAGAAYLRLGANEQIADTSVVYFSGTGPNARFTMVGFSETLGGLQDPSGYGIVENNDNNAIFTNAGPSVLTVNTAAGSNYTFNGYMRNCYAGMGVSSTTLFLVKSGAGSQTLSGPNIGTMAGMEVQNGDLVISNLTSLGQGILVTGGRLVLASTSAIFSQPLTNNAAGGVSFRYANSFNLGTLAGSGGFTLTNETGSAVTLSLGNGNASGNFTGAIDGPGSLVKTGSGTLTLGGDNSYAGLTSISGGVVVVAHNHALGSTASGATTAGGGQITLANGVTVTGESLTLVGLGNNYGALQTAGGASATWAGTVVLGDANEAAWLPRLGSANGGTLTVSGDIVNGVGSSLFISAAGTGKVIVSGTNNSYSGRTGIVRGTLALGRDNALPTGTMLYLNEANGVADLCRLDLSGHNQTVAGLRNVYASSTNMNVMNSGAAATLTVNQASTTTYAGVMSGALSLAKTGAGMLTLSGTNTYSGTTAVSEGALRLNGVNSGGGLITVYSGGILSGTGTVGAVSVQSGGTLAAGNSVGTMYFSDNVEILGTLAVENAGAAVDLLAVTGALTLGPSSTIDLLGTLDGTSSYTILTFTGVRTGTFGDAAKVTAQGYKVDYNANDITLTVIPEPATLGLVGFFAIAAILRRRFGR